MPDLDPLSPAELVELKRRIDEKLGVESFAPPLRSSCPKRNFQPPDDLRRLDAEQLERLTKSFDAWFAAARTLATKRVRARVRLVFQLIRFGGLKLGEVLALDHRKAFDYDRGFVRVGEQGGTVRQAPLPEKVLREIKRLLDDPRLFGDGESAFRLDPGFVRKKFYERGKEAGLPRELVGPGVVRHSFALELLRSGVPLKALQAVLGHQHIGLTAGYVEFSQEQIDRVVKRCMERGPGALTSARNRFAGRVSGLERRGLTTMVEIVCADGSKVMAQVTNESVGFLELELDAPIAALVKAPFIRVFKASPPAEFENRFSGLVAGIERSAPHALIQADLVGLSIKASALVPLEDAVDFSPGDAAMVCFSATSVILSPL